MVERVDRLEAPPVVGRFYLVPTVRYPLWGIERDWPIMGVRHEDKEHLNFPALHYHFDHRFVPPKDFRRVFETDYRALSITVHAIVLSEYERSRPPEGYEELQPHPTWKRRKCWREAVRYPHKEAAESGRAEGFQALWRAYEGAQAVRNASGWVCPHRHYPLGNATRDGDYFVCPLHGLRVHCETGIVKHTLKAAAEHDPPQAHSPQDDTLKGIDP